MKELQKYLQKYKNLTPPEASKKKVLIDAIRSECGITLTENDIALIGGGARLSCHPTVRSEIAQCAPRVLGVLHGEYGVHLAYLR